MKSKTSFLLQFLTVAALLGGCEPKLESPAPELQTATPSLVCGEQLTTVVRLDGSGMSPLPVGTLTGNASLRLPVIAVRRTADLRGDAVGDAEIVVDDSLTDRRVAWISAAVMEVTIDEALQLAPGLWDVRVANADGQDAVAVGAIAVVPRPTLASIVPNLACTAQDATSMTLTGTGFLEVEGRLPTVNFGDVVLPVDSLDDCFDLPGPTGARSCTSAVVTIPVDAVPVGVHDAFLTNPAPAACFSTDPVQIEVVPPPTIAEVAPQPVCDAQFENVLTVTGTSFLVLEDGTLPAVSIGELTALATASDDCVDLLGPAGGKLCTSLTVALPVDALGAGVFDATVLNPAPAACVTMEPARFEVVPPPSLVEVVPELVCTAQGDNALILRGSSFFVTADGALPTFTIGDYTALVDLADDCVALAGPRGGFACATLTATLPVDALPAGLYTAAVTNPDPAGCVSTEAVAFEIVPPPSIESVLPRIACGSQAGTTFDVVGSSFLVYSDTLPSVTIADFTTAADSTTGCVELPGPTHAQLCTGLAFTVPPDVVLAGIYQVTVTNPAPGACNGVLDAAVEYIDPPTVAAVDLPVFCGDEEATTITVTGGGFLRVGTSLPSLLLGDDAFAADSVSGCEPLTGPAGGDLCTTLIATVPAGAVAGGRYTAVVVNPAPAACASAEPVMIDILDAPAVTGLVPDGLCSEADTTQVRILGTGFFFAGAASPSVAIDGIEFAVIGRNGCTAVEGFDAGQLCTEIVVEVESGTFTTIGDVDVDVQNPAPADCSTAVPGTLEVREPPQIESVEPGLVCSEGGVFTIHGSGFSSGTVVLIDGVEAAVATVVDETQIDVETGDVLAPGFYDVELQNLDGCGDFVADAIEVVVGPLLFYVDPPSVYAGIATQASLFVSGVRGAVDEVNLIDDLTGDSQALEFTWDSARPNTVQAVIPAGLAAGTYTMSISDETPCIPFLETAVTVVETATVAVDRLRPAFGWTEGYTPVDVLALDPIPAGEIGFAATPRVYLNPTVPGPETVATGLRSVQFQDAATLRAVVPPGLAPGDYDAIIVNPDGSVGLATAAFRVTELEPPTITSVSPSRTQGSIDTVADVLGGPFRDPTVEIRCTQPDGVFVTRAATINTWDATSIDAILPSNGLAEGTVCVVRATNSDGSIGDYSAVSVGSPSGNLFGFSPGPSLLTARRAPAAVAGRATTTSRYLYAIGGDSGSAAGALDTIEQAPLDAFGRIDAWRALPGSLPAPRTFATPVRIGRYIYLVGGNDGTDAVASVLRAAILDPLEVPRYADLGITFADSDGLPAGLYTYRVAALYAVDDPHNPNGESLPGDPIAVRLPTVPGGVELALSWTPVDRAVGYRIYRSPAADSLAMEHLVDVLDAGTTFVDDNSFVTSTVFEPLRDGALGEWASVGDLPGGSAADAAREAACVTASRDPDTAGRWFIHVAGGRDGAGTVRNTIHMLSVDVDPDDETHGVGAWTTLPQTLSTARWQCGGFVVDDALHSVAPPNETWLYFGGGRTQGGTSGNTDAGRVTGDGTLASFQQVDGPSPARAGYGFAAASNFLYIFGGQGGAPSTDGREAQIATPLPTLSNWNAMGGRGIETARVLMGSAQESAVIFIVGGQTDALPASRSTEISSF